MYMYYKRKMKKSFIVFVILMCFLMFPVCNAKATEAGEGSGVPEIEYTVKKVKKKIYMIPGETRYVSTVVPGDSTFSSSNSRVVSVTNSGLIKAKKAGTAKITHTTGTERKIYTVKVRAEVDLIVFAGQSNMCGAGGNKSLAPTPEYGTAYEFDITTNSKKCILMREPFGEGTNRSTGVSLGGNYSTNGTLVSAFAINYYKQTKTPVVGVSAAWGGSSTNTWLNRGLVKETQRRLKLAKKYLKKKKVKVRHTYMVWYQGESDGQQYLDEDTYISRMKSIYKKMKKTGVEKIFVIQIGHDSSNIHLNEKIMWAQERLCKTNKNFIMVSKKAKNYFNYSYAFYTDNIHLNQNALNEIGYQAGKTAGKYVKKHTKKKK